MLEPGGSLTNKTRLRSSPRGTPGALLGSFHHTSSKAAGLLRRTLTLQTLPQPDRQGTTPSTAQAKHLHPRGQPPPSCSLGLSSRLHLRPPPHLGSLGLVILRHEHVGSLVPCPRQCPPWGLLPLHSPHPQLLPCEELAEIFFFPPGMGPAPTLTTGKLGRASLKVGAAPQQRWSLGDTQRSVLAGDGEKHAKAPLVAWLPSWPFCGCLAQPPRASHPLPSLLRKGRGRGWARDRSGSCPFLREGPAAPPRG